MINGEFKFINCEEYDFKGDDGKRRHGFTCKIYDVGTKKIIKAKSNQFIDKEFGDPIKIGVNLQGDHIKFYVAE